MENEILKLIMSYGVFGVLFVYLFLYQLNDSKQREIKYQNIIDKLTDKFDVIEVVKKDVEEIKNSLI